MKEKMSVTVTSHPERDDLFAELWYGEEQWAEVVIDRQSGSFRLVIYPPEGDERYTFDLDDTQQALAEARSRLEGLGYPS